MNKRKFNISFIILVLLSCFYATSFSQTVKAQVDKDRIFIGEQIKLKLSVEGGRAGITWFHFPDSMNHIEVVRKSKIDTVLNGSYTNYYQTVFLTSFDSGRWEFPALAIASINRFTTPIAIDVLPVDVSKMQDYNDIKDIEEVEQVNNWLIIATIAAITLLSIAVIIWLIVKKKKVIILNEIKKGNISALDWAVAELKKLQIPNELAPAEVKKYYSEMVDISRTFFKMQLLHQMQQQTTDEWMITLQPLQVENEIKIAFFQFLRLADTVKFAKHLPVSSESETSQEAIIQMMQKVSLLHSPIYSNYQPK